MFSLFNLRKAESLSHRQLAYLHLMMSKFSTMPQGLWLQKLDWKKVQYKWCYDMQGTDVIGAFSCLHPDTIYLMPQEHSDLQAPQTPRVYWIQLLFTTIVHQMRHMYQFRYNPLNFVLCSIPLIRQFTIQRDAWNCAQDAQEFAKRWQHQADYVQAANRGMAQEVELG